MSAEMMAKLGLDQSSYQNGLSSASRAADKFAGQVSSTMKTLGTTIAGAFAFDKIIGGFTNAINKGDELQDLANRFGVSASALQEVGNAASLSGASIEDVAKAFNKLAQNAGAALGGNKELQANFELIGVSLQDLQSLSPEELFFKLSDAISSGSLGARDFDVAMSLAGRSAASLMETMSMGSDAIRANGQAMGVWSDETISALSEASDNIKKFGNTLTIVFGNAVPVIDRLIKRYQDLVEAFVLSGNARRNPNLDALGRAALYEQAGNLVSGSEGRTKAASPQSSAANPRLAKQMTYDKDLAEENKKREQEAADYAKQLKADAAYDEKSRAIKREYMLDEFRRGLEQDKIKAEKMASERAAARAAVPGQISQARAAAATGILDIAGQAGSPYEKFVTQARAEAAAAKNRQDIADLEKKAMEEAGKRGSGIDLLNQFGTERSKRDIVRDYLKQQAGKEASGGKTISDLYDVLSRALQKITEAPMVGVN